MINATKLSESLGSLKNAIYTIPYVKHVEFDTDSFQHGSRECVVIVQYHPPYQDSKNNKHQMLRQVSDRLQANGLRKSQIRSESFGDRVYIFAEYKRKTWRTFELRNEPETNFEWIRNLFRTKTKDAVDYIVDVIFS